MTGRELYLCDSVYWIQIMLNQQYYIIPNSAKPINF